MEAQIARLLSWYDRGKRDLPWRRTTNPYEILVSEIMLQQTRAAAVIPYYRRFLDRFPSPESLAGACEQDVLTAWSGLGYYSRARNLQKAAREIQARGGFPRDYESLLELPGVGDYTAAAVASIAFGLPHAVVDGNVLRVVSRVMADSGDIGSKPTRDRLRQVAQRWLAPLRPGPFNQAMMELGATVCLPRDPQCLLCPLAEACQACVQGKQNAFPVKLRRVAFEEIPMTVAVIWRRGDLLLWQRPADSGRMSGFWELPELEQLRGFRAGHELGVFRHTITKHKYTVTVLAGSVRRTSTQCRWFGREELESIPLSTITRKALRLLSLE